jgi:SAM-dependent methyltransferase
MSIETARLHLGCGRTILPGWINLDTVSMPGVDVVADLDACAASPLPFSDASIDQILGSHLLEHIARPLPLMQELHRIARPGCKATFMTPYGSSDDAFEDPTHFDNTFSSRTGTFPSPTIGAPITAIAEIGRPSDSRCGCPRRVTEVGTGTRFSPT